MSQKEVIVLHQYTEMFPSSVKQVRRKGKSAFATENLSAKCPERVLYGYFEWNGGLEGCPMWMRSHSDLERTLSMIGNVSSDIGILILQGENDSATPVEQGLLLQQRLTEVNHPDHLLITYPDLGHSFFPSSEWETISGPIEDYVLEDIFEWLVSPARGLREIES